MSPPASLPTSIKEVTDSLNARSSSDPAKPCRACTDFKTWAKIQAQSSKSDKTSQVNGGGNGDEYQPVETGGTSISSRRADCPVDKDELGRASWTFLHTMAAYYPDKPTPAERHQMKNFISIFANFYPCDSCASHFRKEIRDTPPAVDSQETLSQWFCEMHNRVNKRCQKPIFDCSKINQRWRDGWLDGSCD